MSKTIAFNIHEYSANLTKTLDESMDSISTTNRDIIRGVAKKAAILAEMVRYTEWFLDDTITESEYQAVMMKLQKGRIPNV